MLGNGKQPDGSGRHQPLYWAFTTWHNYRPYGTIFDIGTDGAGPGFNLPEYVKARFGVPFMMTEWNAAPEVQGDEWADDITEQYTGYYGARKTSCIEGVMLYVLGSGNTDYGLVVNGVPNPEPYDAFTGFIAENPDD